MYEKLELVMGGGGGFEKNAEGKVWGVHIIPVGNVLSSSEPPQAINSDRSLRLPFTLSGVFSFPYVTPLIRIGNPQTYLSAMKSL